MCVCLFVFFIVGALIYAYAYVCTCVYAQRELAFTVPVVTTDDQLKLIVVKDEQLVILTWYSITERSPLTVFQINPQTYSERSQAWHARHFEVYVVFDSFVLKLKGVI